MPKNRHLIKRVFLRIVSGILYILSIPKVRDFLWNRVIGKGKKKVIDAKARVVEDSDQIEM